MLVSPRVFFFGFIMYSITSWLLFTVTSSGYSGVSLFILLGLFYLACNMLTSTSAVRHKLQSRRIRCSKPMVTLILLMQIAALLFNVSIYRESCSNNFLQKLLMHGTSCEPWLTFGELKFVFAGYATLLILFSLNLLRLSYRPQRIAYRNR